MPDRRTIVKSAGSVLAGIVLVGCSDSDDTDNNTGPSDGNSDVPIGRRDDEGTNTSVENETDSVDSDNDGNDNDGDNDEESNIED